MLNTIETDRLILREWQDQDINAFVQINQDPLVLEFLPSALSKQEVIDWIKRINQHIHDHGFGLWAATLKSSGECIGYVGLNVPNFCAHFTPCVEIGWRLASNYWGYGYATEAAKAVLDVAFTQLKLKEIVAFTVSANKRSIRIMEKIGMQRNPADDFNHPRLPLDHPLSKHVLYRITK